MMAGLAHYPAVEPYWLMDNVRRLWRRGLDTWDIAAHLEVSEARVYRALSQDQDARARQKAAKA